MVNVIKGIIVSIAAACFFVSVFDAAGAVGDDTQRGKPSRSAQRTAGAETVYKENCARCHAANGNGKTPLGEKLDAPDFTDREWWLKHRNTARLTTSVMHGKGSMPAFEKKLSRTEIRSLVAYVRRFKR